MTAKLIARTSIVAVVVALAAGAVYATIPDAAGVIHGCYTKSGGSIRIIDDGVTTCKQGEVALTWSVQGPQGLPGQPGAPGQQGIPGDNHVFGVGTTVAGTAQDLTVADLGTVRAECTTASVPRVTLSGSAPFSFADGNGSGEGFNQTTWTNRLSFDSVWLRNVQGQWHLEYAAFQSNLVASVGCTVAVEITRIN